jgi:hypothetical protein
MKIDRSKIGERWLENFKGKHLFALVLEVGSPAQTRTTGINAAGEPTHLYQSARQAHGNFNYYNPGDWYNYPLGEKVIAVHLYREDGKEWHKQPFQASEGTLAILRGRK